MAPRNRILDNIFNYFDFFSGHLELVADIGVRRASKGFFNGHQSLVCPVQVLKRHLCLSQVDAFYEELLAELWVSLYQSGEDASNEKGWELEPVLCPVMIFNQLCDLVETLLEKVKSSFCGLNTLLLFYSLAEFGILLQDRVDDAGASH